MMTYGSLFGTSTPFESCEEMQSLHPILNQFEAKENELATAAKEKGPDSIDAKKYDIIKQLRSKFCEAINRFNREVAIGEEDYTLSVSKLIDDFKISVTDIVNSGEKAMILITPRNNYRTLFDKVVHYGFLGGSIVTAFVVPLTTFSSILAFVSAHVCSNAVRDSTGLTDNIPKSARLFYDFIKSLDQIDKDHSAYLNCQKHITPRF